MRLDIAQVARMLADKAEDVCRWLLPNGKRQNAEWCVGNVHGDAGNSLRVNLTGKAGVWRDFAADEKGGDLLDLLMACRGLSKSDAVREAKAFLGVKDEDLQFTPKRKAYSRPEAPKGYKTANGAALAFFQARGINAETVAAFKIAETAHDIVFPYLDEKTLKFYKCRNKKEKRFWASKDAEPILFGWQSGAAKSRHVVITEGEIDAMSFHQQGQPAVSVPFGGGSDGKQDAWIDSEWNRLQLFDTIYLALDMDDMGRKAAEYIAQRLGRHRCRIVDFGQYKDANEAHMAGAQLVSYLICAKFCDPPELRSATDYLDDIIAIFRGEKDVSGYSLPWKKADNIIRLRKNEISLWAGINGHGKSQVLGHVVVGSIPQGECWCIASMEFKPPTMLARMYRQASGVSQPEEEACRVAIAPFFNGNIYIFDVQGTAKADRILYVFEYAYRRYGCTSFLVDSLAKCGFGEDDYNGQKSFVDRLMGFAQTNSVHVHLVCHARKQKDENTAPGKMDIKGTGALSDMVDNVFTVWRNKHKEKELTKGNFAKQKILSEPDCILECSKQRNGEWEGRLLLWFDSASLQYKAEEGHLPRVYVKTHEAASDKHWTDDSAVF